ncbi:MAG: ABC transporter permease [Gemmatimonadaceae bacterium]
MRVRDWFRREALGAELADELRFHRSALERDAVASGDSAVDAAHRAQHRLGNSTRIQEDARERWSIPTLDNFLNDARYALRGLRRSPGFTATVIATLGLGIGANVAMFGVVDHLMFRPLPFLRDASSVNRVYLQTSGRERILTSATFPYTRYLDLKNATTSFSQYAAFAQNTWAIGVGETAREQPVAAVSASFFEFFNARPEVGRFFDASEDVTPRGASVAVLDYSYWQRELGGKNVVGQPLQIGTISYTIIGIAPKGFVGVATDHAPVAYVPITTVAANDNQWNLNTYFTNYRWDWASMMVRRKPGVKADAATADLTHAFVKSRAAARALVRSVAPANVALPKAIAGSIKLAAGPSAGLESKTLLWVTGVAAIVLLIACANVTNLMFARLLKRRREIAMRLALGVGRGRLLMMLLTESLMLAIAGGVAGVLVAQWGGAALRVILLPEGTSADVVTSWRTLGVAIACAVVSGGLMSIGPALLAMRGSLATTLRADARGGIYQRSRTRSTLLVMQGALSVTLLVGAGLFVRSLNNVRSIRLGYDAEQVLMALPNTRGFHFDSAARVQFNRMLMQAAAAIPDVENVALVDSRPFATSMALLYVDGIDSVQKFGRFDIQYSTSDYFRTMGTRILRGRAFNDDDREGTPRVSVVSASMARVLWPGKDALGQCIRISADSMPCTTIVGIAEDAAYDNITDDRRYVQYVPLAQTDPAGGNKMLLRVKGLRAGPAMTAVQRGLQRVMPGNGYVTVQSFGDIVNAQRRSWELGATMFVAFGALALLVAAVGLYGVIAYNVAQRLHELAVRVALGAQQRDVIRLVVGQGVSFAIAGVTIGLAAALMASRWIQPLLFRQSATDPLTFGAVGLIIIFVAILASAIPAWRATQADPNKALRSD